MDRYGKQGIPYGHCKQLMSVITCTRDRAGPFEPLSLNPVDLFPNWRNSVQIATLQMIGQTLLDTNFNTILGRGKCLQLRVVTVA